MLKKLFVFAGWLLLLCLVFIFCCITGLWHEWSTVTIFAVWVSVLIAAVLLWVSLLWLTQLIKDNKARCFFRKFRLSRREFVLFEHWKSGAAVVRRIQRKRPRSRGICCSATAAAKRHCWPDRDCRFSPGINRTITLYRLTPCAGGFSITPASWTSPAISSTALRHSTVPGGKWSVDHASARTCGDPDLPVGQRTHERRHQRAT